MIELPVLQGCGTIQLPAGLNTLVDSGDRRLLNALTWGIIHSKGKFVYPIHQVRSGGILTSVKMHRFILDPPNGLDVDHKNGDTLDNRRENLRIATRSQNCCNKEKPRRAGATSRFKGVSSRPNGKWDARITKNGVTKYLGYFDTEEAAAEAYNKAAQIYHGQFATANSDAC